MELTDYLDPVELEKPEDAVLDNDELFGKSIYIYTENNPLPDLSDFDIAILGVPEDRNSNNHGASLTPDKVRIELYNLIKTPRLPKIADLGNLKAGNTYSDTYYALKDLTYQCLCNNLTLVIIGGTQDLTYALFQAFELYKDKINLVTVDSKLDIQKKAVKPDSSNYLIEILLKKRKLFKYTNLGHQAYFNDSHRTELIQRLFHDSIRLGEIRNDIKRIEPVLRDVDLVSFDISSIRQADAPGQLRPSPNGFQAEEACQITRYSGLSDSLRIFGLFEINPKYDNRQTTSLLASQLIWYFIDGFAYRNPEFPDGEDQNFKTFIIGHNDLDYEMRFFKSTKTQRWWMEVPDVKNSGNVIISCSYEDYQSACNQEVPDLWWKTYQKLC